MTRGGSGLVVWSLGAPACEVIDDPAHTGQVAYRSLSVLTLCVWVDSVPFQVFEHIFLELDISVVVGHGLPRDGASGVP